MQFLLRTHGFDQNIFEPDGHLTKIMEMEHRPQQADMAFAVAQKMQENSLSSLKQAQGWERVLPI